jgi:hypothetical protein
MEGQQHFFFVFFSTPTQSNLDVSSLDEGILLKKICEKTLSSLRRRRSFHIFFEHLLVSNIYILP